MKKQSAGKQSAGKQSMGKKSASMKGWLPYLAPLLFGLPLAAGVLAMSAKYAGKAISLVSLAVKMGVNP